MPVVEWSDPVGVRAPCPFSVAPNGTVSDEWIVWQEREPLAAGCHGHSVDVFASDQQILFHRGDACRPAWKPDGSLTFIARGELILTVRFRRERVLLSREDIAKALGAGMKLEEVAWIDNRQFASVLHSGPAVTLAVFRGRRLVHRPGFSALRIEHLRAGRDMIAALTNGPGPASVTFFDFAGGRTFALRAHAFAWSPGGTIVAAAGRRRLFFVEPTTGEFRSLPLVAADVEWVER
jgi:hypothetical protein